MAAIRDAARNAYLRVRGPRVDVQGESTLEESALEFLALKPGLLHVLPGHTRSISSLAFVPGSDLVVSGSYDSRCRVWSASEGREVGAQMKNERDVNAVAVSVDRKMVVYGGDDGRIIICSLDTRKKMFEWATQHQRVYSLSFSSDGRLASGHEDGSVIIWNPSTGTPTAGPFRFYNSWVLSISFSPSGERIAFGGRDGRIRVVYSHSGEDVIPAIEAHQGLVHSVIWSPNGQHIISASDDHTIKFWNSSVGSLLATCKEHTDFIHSLAISSDGELLASASNDRTVRLWDTSTHQQIRPPLEHPELLNSVAISSDGHYLAAGGFDTKVYIWNLRDIPEEAQLVASDTKSDTNNSEPAVDTEIPIPNSGDSKSSEKTDADADAGVPEAHKQPQSESPDVDNNAAPNWLDQPAVSVASNDGVGGSHYAPGGAFWVGMEDSLSDPPAKGKGKQKAEEATAPDDLDSPAQRRLFKRVNLKRFKPSKGISNPFKSAHKKTATLAPQAPVEPPKFRPPTGASAGPSRPSESSITVSLRDHSATPEGVTVSAARSKKFIVVVRGGKRYPKDMKITKWSMPWIKLAYKRRELELSDLARPSAPPSAQPTNALSSQVHSPAEGTCPQGSTTNSAPPPATGDTPSSDDEGDSGSLTSSTSSHGAGGRPPSVTSFTTCDMLLLWLCYPRRVDRGPSLN
ncbi:hypothetical protein HYDPIDRAFT_30857 [Hydnomerulius pinastri MD-312]|uniref:WD40 repeat-like protein n=1 Tax=Hydnomerulius pinastri MD-312 TaxID=994086 RepID=A0A0C9VVC0_9AGAM|nr:hypothetical protein HYDPIDRAFT_30857 [Hydnomerulius pinastri MD-312]